MKKDQKSITEIFKEAGIYQAAIKKPQKSITEIEPPPQPAEARKPISKFEIGETQFLIIELMTLISGMLIGFLFRGP